MLLIYNCFIRIYRILIFIVAFFNKKAKLWQNGRKNSNFVQLQNSTWFHFASLGEFEQGRPVLEKMRTENPSKSIVITFFSPSGYEVRKNTPLANYVYYLPLDTKKNARRFIAAIKPDVAIFTKYEYWYHFFNELNKQQIPLYMISSIFRPDQVFFKWYGGLHRKMLGFVTRFFVQDEDSKTLLQNIGIYNVSVSGDTRFDRVWANAQKPTALPIIEQFKNNAPVFIGGSTWPDDEQLIASLVPLYPNWKFIIAPHEITDEKIAKLKSLLPENETIKFSEIRNSPATVSNDRVLIIDNIGMLYSLYQYGDIAFIGGGFGVGIHNTLEAAAFGLPVIIGPNYQKFREARDIISLGLGYSINHLEELKPVVDKLVYDIPFRKKTGVGIKAYVEKNTGATETIIKAISV
jgi:3-deoxy-D-manno-octulosonic-acid transferase